jgi:hypothetical protein
MVITTNAKNRVRDLIVNELSTASLGRDGTTATASDTDLGDEVAVTIKTPTVSTDNKTISITHNLLSTEANGETLREFGVKLTGDILLDRVVFPDYEKTAANELTTIDIVRID